MICLTKFVYFEGDKSSLSSKVNHIFFDDLLVDNCNLSKDELFLLGVSLDSLENDFSSKFLHS